MLRLAPYALLMFATPGLSAPAVDPAAAPTANHAWVRLNAVPGRPAAGYVSIHGGTVADRLVGVTAPGVRVEMHSMSMAGGMMSMAKLDGLAVPAGTVVNLAPGGNHLMLFELKQVPVTMPLTLNFASGAKLLVTAQIRNAGDDALPSADPSAH